jgi:hypothetical protein
MNSDEDALQAFKNAVFNAGVSPGRGYVQFFADAMCWPVDAFASRTVSDDNRFEHQDVVTRGGPGVVSDESLEVDSDLEIVGVASVPFCFLADGADRGGELIRSAVCCHVSVGEPPCPAEADVGYRADPDRYLTAGWLRNDVSVAASIS